MLGYGDTIEAPADRPVVEIIERMENMVRGECPEL